MEIAKWIAFAIVVAGVVLILCDLIINISRRRNMVLNILGLVFLTLALVAFILTQIVFKEQLPPMFAFLWIALLAGYLVCDIITAVKIGKSNRAEGNKGSQAEE